MAADMPISVTLLRRKPRFSIGRAVTDVCRESSSLAFSRPICVDRLYFSTVVEGLPEPRGLRIDATRIMHEEHKRSSGRRVLVSEQPLIMIR